MTAGQLTQLYTIATQHGCGADKIQFLIESGFLADFFAGNWKDTDREMFRAICKLSPADFGVFPRTMTIKLGTGLKTPDDFRRELKKEGVVICQMADDILGQPGFTISETEMEVDIVLLTHEEMGFFDWTSNAKRDERAKELELELCPAEVGPQMRLQYAKQMNGETVTVAMKPIKGSIRAIHTFCVCKGEDGKSYLSSAYGYSGSSSTPKVPNRYYAYMKPRK